MKYYTSLLLWIVTSTAFSQYAQNALIPIKRHTFSSEILKEERSFQVYLPPSYFYSDQGSFPVVYLMDGDYNFYHDTGLIEFLSTVADKIPEMIVVGISDKGSAKYREYCRPNAEGTEGGRANTFMTFLEEELKPLINKKYRTSSYEILVGHSMGGLFVTNHYLEKPDTFHSYIAIDPSLWWNDYALTKKANTVFMDQKELSSNLFISLANTQGMGVRGFVGVLDTYFPYDTKWSFTHYEDENHGSVHMIAVKEALLQLFKNWEVSRDTFYTFKSSQDLMDHYKKLNSEFTTQFSLPAYNFGNMMNYYYRKNLTADIAIIGSEIMNHFPNSLDEFYSVLGRYHLEAKKYEEAEKTYNTCLIKRPNSFRAYDGLSKVYTNRKEFKKATETSRRAIELAKKANARQWQLNELQSNLDNIIELSKKKN
ncbi:alpha/beta hydrolase-fold protein [uncultured Aquimarina sp.]|uniref:alpha/beta hydrolase-fold protein n=1 Tax=uncultured Aquimarina sp. TaxID=575652 RepID=UPI0026282D86|nr:alpha/beta hydrolase-fold protein [uncultured Aquimarina sp.]